MIGKILFVLVLIAIIVYTFKDSAGDIMAQLKDTSLLVITGICIASVLYELVEGWITWSLAKVYNPDFKYWQGVESAFYAAFYRVATLGSGAGVAAIYYFNGWQPWEAEQALRQSIISMKREFLIPKGPDYIPLNICCTKSVLLCFREYSFC